MIWNACFELLGEDVGVIPIGQPPGLLSPNVFLGSGGEANVPVFQRDRSSRRTTSASISRPALTSSSESLQGAMQRGAIFIGQPITGIKG